MHEFNISIKIGEARKKADTFDYSEPYPLLFMHMQEGQAVKRRNSNLGLIFLAYSPQTCLSVGVS